MHSKLSFLALSGVAVVAACDIQSTGPSGAPRAQTATGYAGQPSTGEPTAPEAIEAGDRLGDADPTRASEPTETRVPLADKSGEAANETGPANVPATSLLLSVSGQVASDTDESVAVEVGVVWLNLLDDNTTVLVEPAVVDAVGADLPAAFDASLIAPPSQKMLGVTLQSWSEGGASEYPVDSGRVAFGVVVVALEGTLENLPASASLTDFISTSDATPGPLLSSLSLVSAYSVRYVQGAEAEGLVLHDIQGVAYPVSDFTVLDLGDWARGVENALCRDRRLGEGWAAPEVQTCIADNQDRIAAGEAAAADCAAACGSPAEGASDDEVQSAASCAWACLTQGDTKGNVENECLYAWASSQAEATDALCGPVPDFAQSDFRSARRLAPGESLELSLGSGDIREALTAGGFTFLY